MMKRLLLMGLLTVLIVAPASAQAPTVAGVFPPGAQAGSTLPATVSGANLADVQTVLVSGAGVRIEKAMGGSAGTCPVTLTVDPEAPVGMREVRVVTPRGVSNARRIWVGRYPHRLEQEPND